MENNKSNELEQLKKQCWETKTRLEKTNNFLRNILESSSAISVISTDLQQNVLYWNSGAENIFGYKSSEIVGKHKVDIIYSGINTSKKADHIRKQIVKTKKGAVCELRQITKSGRQLWSKMTLTPSFDDKGNVIGILGIGEDITEHKKADKELHLTMNRLKKTLEGIIHTTEIIIETRDPYTAGHQRRVANLAQAIARNMGLSDHTIEGLYMVGVIHDLGKISVPAEILSMPRRLTSAEMTLIRTHPKTGYDILKPIHFPWPVAEIILQHHERLDGSGYPNRLSGKDIMLEARVIAVADVVEAMASHRPYRSAFTLNRALGEINQNKDILYDAKVVEACLDLFKNKKYKLEKSMNLQPKK